MAERPGNPWDLFSAAGFPLTEKQRGQLEIYAKELIKWNRKINLTSLHREEEIVVRHFLGSLTFLYGFDPAAQSEVLDLGSGAGFPGLPIKIFHPEISLTLVEAAGKKIAFLKHIGRTLGLRNVRYEAQRSETLARQPSHREAFDVVLCRAVGKLEKIVAFAFPFLKCGGDLVTQKGWNFQAEVRAGTAALARHGAVVETVIPVILPWRDVRYALLVVRKAIAIEEWKREETGE